MQLLRTKKPEPCPQSPSTTSPSSPASRSRIPSWRASEPVRQLTTAPSGYEGEGFPVRRAFAGVLLEDLDPFIHLDQMGEVEYAPGEAKGTPWHPHRGFETVTYMLDGVFEHHDSNGGGGPHHQRRHAVDDRRRRHPAHREAPGVAGRPGRPVPRLPAVGQPAARPEARRAALPGHPRQRGGARLVARRRRPRPRDRRRGRRPRRPGLDVHAHDPRPRDAQPGRHPAAAVAQRLQRARLRPVGPGHDRRRGPAGEARASWRCSGRATR